MIYLDKSTDQQPVYVPKDEYTGTPGGHTAILQEKDWEITQNGITRVTPDAGYDGISGGSIVVYVNSDTATTFEHLTTQENGTYVPTGNTAYSAVTVDVDLETPYEEGVADGKALQKAKLASTTITRNGNFFREDGWNSLVIRVPQSGGTINNQAKEITITANTATTVTYDPDYTGLESVGIFVNVPSPSYTFADITADTNNRTYYPAAFSADAFTRVTVDIDTTPYYDSGYTEGYASGRTDGIDYQKSLLATTTITANGNYTRADGWSGVSVNVPPQIVTLTQAQYDDLDPIDPTTIYLIKD